MLGNKLPAIQSKANNVTNVLRAQGAMTTAKNPAYSNIPRDQLGYASMTPANQQNYWNNWDARGGAPAGFREYLESGPTAKGTSVTPNYAQSPMAGTSYQTPLTGSGYSPVGQNQTSPTSGMSGMGQVNSSIQPREIYPQWMTDVASNTAQAQADQQGNLPYVMKMFDRPGVSRSSAQMALAAPMVAQSQVQGATARAQIPFEDYTANQRNLFLGQVARENESLQLGNLLARIAEANQQNQLSQLQRQSSLMAGLVG